MRGKRRDLHKAKLRRERTRREKHLSSTHAPPDDMPRFSAERAIWDIESLLEGRKFDSVDELNAELRRLTEGDQLRAVASAWNQGDPKRRAQELAYDALEADDMATAVQLINEALEWDPHCTDAQRLMVSILPMDLDNRIKLTCEVVVVAERNMGEAFIQETTGYFWQAVSTRPYMRAKRYLAELLVEAERFLEAVGEFEEILELNPEDNLGARFMLPVLYLAIHQPESADRILTRFAEENVLATPAWARVMERWLSSAANPQVADEAETTLVRARKVNPFVERYLSGVRPTPKEQPAFYRPGSEAEAQICVSTLQPAVRENPGFRDWLRANR